MTSLCVSVCVCIMGQESWASSSDFVPFLYKPLFKEHSINTLTTGRITVIILPRVHCVRVSQTNVDSSRNISLSAGEPSVWASSAAPAENYISSCVSFLPCASENVMTNAKGSKPTKTSPYLIRDGLYLCAYHLNRKGCVLPPRQKFRPCLRLRIQWQPRCLFTPDASPVNPCDRISREGFYRGCQIIIRKTSPKANPNKPSNSKTQNISDT